MNITRYEPEDYCGCVENKNGTYVEYADAEQRITRLVDALNDLINAVEARQGIPEAQTKAIATVAICRL